MSINTVVANVEGGVWVPSVEIRVRLVQDLLRFLGPNKFLRLFGPECLLVLNRLIVDLVIDFVGKIIGFTFIPDVLILSFLES